MARNAAEQLKKVSTTIEERSQADRILQFIEAARSNTAKPVLAFEESDDLPGLNRRDAAPEALRPVVRRPSLTGKFVDLECEEHAKVVIETAEGKKFFLIEDPSKLLVNGKSGETMDLSCGPQKPVQIRIEYDPPGLNRPGIDGVVRVIRFDQ
jgi:hypothetical protein